MDVNKIQQVADTNEPEISHFFLDGKEVLNGTVLEVLGHFQASDGRSIWIQCVFYVDPHIMGQHGYVQELCLEDYLTVPLVVIWLGTEAPGAIAAKVSGNPLDAHYRWPMGSGRKVVA